MLHGARSKRVYLFYQVSVGQALDRASELSPRSSSVYDICGETFLTQQALEKAIAPEYEIEERSTLAVRLVRDNDCLWEALCLNEMMLRREPLTCMCHFEVAIDRHASIDITDKATARDIIKG